MPTGSSTWATARGASCVRRSRRRNGPTWRPSSGSYHMTLHRLEGEQRFHVAIEETGRVADICTTRKRPRRVVGRSG